MESSAIFTAAFMRHLRAASVCAVSGNLITGEVVYETENTGLIEGWDREIRVVLEAIVAFENSQKV